MENVRNEECSQQGKDVISKNQNMRNNSIPSRDKLRNSTSSAVKMREKFKQALSKQHYKGSEIFGQDQNEMKLPLKELEYSFCEYRFCEICESVKPPRSHHCRHCEKCILRMDHHCFWIANCIGFNNHKFFVLLCFYGIITEIISSLIFFNNWKFIITQTCNRLIVFLYLHAFVLFLFSLGLGALLIFHLYLISHNITTIELYLLVSEDKGIFDLKSCMKNFEQILGIPRYTWLLPISPQNRATDGMSFPINIEDIPIEEFNYFK